MTVDTSGSVSVRQFDEIFESIKNWGRWGKDDQRGALNLITPDKVRQGAAAVREGRTISCAQTLATTTAADNPTPVMHFMVRAADLIQPEALSGGSSDYINMSTHGPANTHIDGFCHFIYRGKLYNGFDASVVTSRGAEAMAIIDCKDGLSSRGVLLDMPRLKGVDFLERGSLISTEDLKAAEDAQGVHVESGDILLVRTGELMARASLGARSMAERVVAGLHPETLLWLHERDVAVLGGDADSDPQPSPMKDLNKPIHCGTLVGMGVHLLDNCALDELATACADIGRWEFQFSVAPLRLEKGTGSPINPIATI